MSSYGIEDEAAGGLSGLVNTMQKKWSGKLTITEEKQSVFNLKTAFVVVY